MGLTGLAAGAAGLALPSAGRAASQPAVARDPDVVLAHLLAGNKRFVSGQLVHPGARRRILRRWRRGRRPWP